MRREIIKIGICDADRKFTGEIEMFIICSEKRYNLHFEVDVFFSGEKLCEAINKGIFFDIILLDFKIGNMNGIQVARWIRFKNKNDISFIIFISEYHDYWRDLCGINVEYFFDKPINYDLFSQVLCSVIEKLNLKSQTFSFRCKTDYYTVEKKDILYFEKQNKQVIINTNFYQMMFYSTISETHEELNDSNFTICHAAFIVNLKNVIALGKKEIFMKKGMQIPISYHRRREVVNNFKDYHWRESNKIIGDSTYLH